MRVEKDDFSADCDGDELVVAVDFEAADRIREIFSKTKNKKSVINKELRPEFWSNILLVLYPFRSPLSFSILRLSVF